MPLQNTYRKHMSRKLQNRPLKGQSLKELRGFFESIGQPSYRGEQLFRWLYQKNATSFDDITTFSKDLREKLSADESLERGWVIKKSKQSDEGTVKYLIQLEDGKKVESVYIPQEDRVTVCLSSQIGCALDCDFCATGKMGFHRHLDAGEIFEQFRLVQQLSDRPVTNIVFMGMGEPFNNYDEVLRAADIFNNSMGPNIGRNRITISTAGVVPQIKQYADERRPYTLAISLNATRDDFRDILMPLNQRWPIQALMDAARYYTTRLSRRITFEYVLIAGYSDSPDDAARLKRMLRNIECKLNVIPLNATDSVYRRPDPEDIDRFLQALYPAPFPITVRWSKGHDISAACGQLYTENA